jgi:hypothetical protein
MAVDAVQVVDLMNSRILASHRLGSVLPYRSRDVGFTDFDE